MTHACNSHFNSCKLQYPLSALQPVQNLLERETALQDFALDLLCKEFQTVVS